MSDFPQGDITFGPNGDFFRVYAEGFETKGPRPWIDVRAYGASGNGHSDDTDAIDNAFAAVKPGGVVLFPEGTYVTRGNHQVPGGVTVRGGSTPQQGATLKLKDSANPDAVLVSKAWATNATSSAEPIIIENLRVDGNKANNTSGDGIIIMNYRSRVQGVTVANCAGNGVRFTAKNKAGTVISNTEVENRLLGCFITACNLRGFYCEEGSGKVTDGFCIDNIIANCAGDGIDIERSSGWVIRGNHLYTNEDNGIVARFGFFTIIEGNYVEGYGINNDGGTYRGILCPSGLGAPVFIRGNRIRNSNTGGTNTYRAIEAGGGTGVNTTFHITDNHVDGNGSERGLWSFSSGGGGSVRGTIMGNYFANVAAQVLDIPNTYFFAIEGNSFNYASAVPSTGKWPAGMHVWNSAPAAGGDPGWVCVTGGSPGTWKAMANLDA